MGFLQHSSNNIILDAVLTDTGRQFLSRNDGSFSIIKFALGDDEVDYTVIKKFGRTVGKEKIEKNTPVFEALTNQAGQKFKLVSISNPNLIRFPTLQLVGGSSIIQMGRTSTRQQRIVIRQTIQNENAIDVELSDQMFEIEMNNMFLQVSGDSPDNIDGQQKARYSLPPDSAQTAQGGSQLTFTLELKSITDAQFTVFGTTQDKTQIRTYVKVTGLRSGTVKEFEVLISKTG
jgi:LEA14-like dessication related protein